MANEKSRTVLSVVSIGKYIDATVYVSHNW